MYSEFEKELLHVIDSLYTLALSLTRKPEDAEDLLQDTAVRGLRYYKRFKKGTNFKAWIMTIMRSIFINDYRKKKKQPCRVDFETAEPFIPSRNIHNQNEMFLKEMVREAVGDLSWKLRRPVTLFYVAGYNYKEIAEALDLPLGSVMSRLYNARQKLKNKLKHVYSEQNSCLV